MNLNPWRKTRELSADLARSLNEIEALERALKDSAERYDKIRDANRQLRQALDLYRDASR